MEAVLRVEWIPEKGTRSGTVVSHFFNEKHPAFVRMQALAAVRNYR
jgi:hypothetical protein